MKIKEARAIVAKMVKWSMLSQGIDIETPDLITEDLQSLLKANRIVEKSNERSKKRIDKIVAEKGSWKGSRSVQMTIADRGIAAIYVAANFQGDKPETAEILSEHDGNIVLCLNKSML